MTDLYDKAQAAFNRWLMLADLYGDCHRVARAAYLDYQRALAAAVAS